MLCTNNRRGVVIRKRFFQKLPFRRARAFIEVECYIESGCLFLHFKLTRTFPGKRLCIEKTMNIFSHYGHS